MQSICHRVIAAYVRRLYALFRMFHIKSTEEKGFNWLFLCHLDPPQDNVFFDIRRGGLVVRAGL